MGKALTGVVSDTAESRYLLGKAYTMPWLAFLQALSSDTPVSAPTDGLVYTLRPAAGCAMCSGPLAHQHACRAGAPNLQVPAFGLKVWWHSAPLRGAWTNKPVTVAQWSQLLNWVLAAEFAAKRHTAPAHRGALA